MKTLRKQADLPKNKIGDQSQNPQEIALNRKCSFARYLVNIF